MCSPGDGSLVGTVRRGTEKDVQTAIDAATEAQKVLARMSVLCVHELLWKAYTIAERRAEADAVVLSRECGKTITEARSEVSDYNNLTTTSRRPRVSSGCAAPSSPRRRRRDRQAHHGHPPAGRRGRHHLTLELADGYPDYRATTPSWRDAVIMKPACTTPFSVINLAEVYDEAGFPRGP